MNINEFFKNNPKVAVAFSGGTDSSYLLYAAKENGCDVHAYHVKSAFQPQFELDDAKRLAEELSVPITILEHDVSQSEVVMSNPSDRCYHCKNLVFSSIWKAAKADGYPLLVDGTNASDDASDRPGMRALAELEVKSPLRECGITKHQVRELSLKAGLFTWNKPSYACLATRIPTNTKITLEALERVEKSEDALFKLGFSDLRVRVIGKTAKLQLTEEQLAKAVSLRTEIISKLSPYFKDILLDLTPRKES